VYIKGSKKRHSTGVTKMQKSLRELLAEADRAKESRAEEMWERMTTQSKQKKDKPVYISAVSVSKFEAIFVQR
jgi:hypothetical protein